MSTNTPVTQDAADGPEGRKPRLRFPKAARLFRAAEFTKVREKGRSVHGRFMLIGVLHEQGTDAARFGMVTSRRVGSAVDRNAVRRRLREVARHARPALKPGVWMVTVAKKAASEASLGELREEWTRLARKAACFRE